MRVGRGGVDWGYTGRSQWELQGRDWGQYCVSEERTGRNNGNMKRRFAAEGVFMTGSLMMSSRLTTTPNCDVASKRFSY